MMVPKGKGWIVYVLLGLLLGVTGEARARSDEKTLPGNDPPLAVQWDGSCPAPLYLSDSDRFGVDWMQHDLARYDFGTLGSRWYMSWWLAPAPLHPNNMDFVQMVRTCRWPGAIPTPMQLQQTAIAQPGALWLIGNEPDGYLNDDCSPEEYAQAYHDAYITIKAADPTAVLAPGGIIQATPLRLSYLDLVLEAYEAHYGQPMPADAWQIHGFILREERGNWGAGIPRGLDVDSGRLYNIRDGDSVGYFADQVMLFRQWMADHGWQNLPLHISESGVLLPEFILDEDGHPFDTPRLQKFMTSTFDFLLGAQAVNAQVGYPPDGYRLAQTWGWYSLSDDIYNDQGQLLGTLLNGDLFVCDHLTCKINPLGETYAGYVASVHTAYVDLWPPSLSASFSSAGLGDTFQIPIKVRVANLGNVTSTLASSVHFTSTQGTPGPDGPFGALPPRYAGSVEVSTTWTLPITGSNVLWTTVDAAGQTADINRCNNTRPFTLTFTGDALPQTLTLYPGHALLWGGRPITITASVQAINPGNVLVRDVDVLFLRDGQVWGDLLQVKTLAAGQTLSHQVTWTELGVGSHEIVARVSSPMTGQKQLVAHLYIVDKGLFLPLVLRNQAF